ncbi:MAG: hypothetical protein AAF557_01560 [Pseudomonadota bacterium]
MEGILELVSLFVADGVYGTQERPRHPIWRNALRVFVFSGALVAAWHLFTFNTWPNIHIVFSVIWGLAFLTVFSAEYYLGRPWLSLAAGVAGIILLLLGLRAEGVFS